MIKTYHNIHPVNDAMIFEIKRMEDIYDLGQGLMDEPHRHDYYTLIIVESADGEHVIDFNSYPLHGLTLHFVNPGQVHQVKETKRSKGWILTFYHRFLIQHAIADRFISDIHLFKSYGQSAPLPINSEHYDTLSEYCGFIESAMRKDIGLKMDVVGAYLKLILIECHRLSQFEQESKTQLTESGTDMLKVFRSLVESHFTKEHHVAFYAGQMSITSDYLNKAIKSYTGETAKTFIQNRIMIEAKRMLLYSQNTAKSIALDLGFKESAHFSNFFKKCSGASISQFKSSIEQA